MDNPERREREQQHSTEAHQRIRRNSDRRNEEQIHNTEAHRHVRLQNPERRRAEQERDTIGKSIYFNILINNDAIAHRMAREDPVQRLEEHQRDLLHRREARSDPQYQAREQREQHINSGVIAKSGLMAYGLMALWPCGLRFFIVLLPIIQHRCTHPGFTGFMQAAKAAYRLHIISASVCPML